jgi:hypothetical protein
MKKILRSPFCIRLSHWEYWPFHVVYALVYPYWLWLCIKTRSFFFFSVANPSIKNGGFLMESKNDIYSLIPEKFYPKTLFFKLGTCEYEVLKKIQEKKFQFPLVGKPDIGMRGMAVKKLKDNYELLEYIQKSKVDYLIQEFVSYEMEAGIFYYRFPNEKKGNISGIVYKEFLTVEGDGVSTILQLLQEEKRFILQIDELKKQNAEQLSFILPKGVKKVLVPYGNHSRGAKFIDASQLIDEKLIDAIDEVCNQISGFYYGRLDIRFNSWEKLNEGKNFSIIELNGAGSEPTHIYDPAHSIFFAWKEIIRHWNILYRISKQNRNKSPYMNFNSGIKMFRENFAYLKLLNSKEEIRA